ncbi:hypothetical protein NJB1907f44_02370 [Mycobacterium marinum]|nr:hypothetical protein NJB1808e29_38980 [Mycobacterium marinum]GJO08288.1 hypothetical protein NJB1907f34b_36020 [Mycobacterium marinum]GJO09147.1 hypothetical protein NJB1907E90_25450 [Mycobacterium marinum]GJO14829.1 hypothetical protein NJB1728e18_05870 [Mycobacterium marinum]GJO22148.1 hypothetical protein NJB1907E11_32080 [Mycobacterium marinum]
MLGALVDELVGGIARPAGPRGSTRAKGRSSRDAMLVEMMQRDLGSTRGAHARLCPGVASSATSSEMGHSGVFEFM